MRLHEVQNGTANRVHTNIPRAYVARSAGLFTLNSFKTEFLLIGLENQLAKIHNASSNTSQSSRSLGLIFDKHLTFFDHIFLRSLLLTHSSTSLYPTLPRL